MNRRQHAHGTAVLMITFGIIGLGWPGLPESADALLTVAVCLGKGCLALLPGVVWPLAALVVLLWGATLGKAWGKIG